MKKADAPTQSNKRKVRRATVPIISPTPAAFREMQKNWLKVLAQELELNGRLRGITINPDAPMSTLDALFKAIGKKQAFFEIYMNAVERYPEKRPQG